MGKLEIGKTYTNGKLSRTIIDIKDGKNIYYENQKGEKASCWITTFEDWVRAGEKKNNKLVWPAIYKHFKGKYYATMGISKPMRTKEIEEIGSKIFTSSEEAFENNRSNFIYCNHTELNRNLLVCVLNGELYHQKEVDNNELVLYKSLYDDTGVYVRPIDMFLSKVDKEISPKVKQKYRFELVRY